MTCQIWIRPVKTSKPRMSASAICQICVAIRIFAFIVTIGRRAANHGQQKRRDAGAKFTIPSMIALFVSVLMTQPWAMTCIQVPVSEMSEPMM